MPRLSLVLASLLSAAFASPSDASATYDLVEPQVCLAGSWGSSSRLEWRVQLGVFDEPNHAEALASSLRARGLCVETYLAAWLAGGDREPRVVVSSAYASRDLAERAASDYRGNGSDAMVRRFVVWRR